MSETEPVVLVRIEDRIATVTLNRPEARSALSRQLTYELWDAVAAVDGPDHGLVDDRQEAKQAVGVTLGASSGFTGRRGWRRLPGRFLEADAGAEGRVGAGEDHRVDEGYMAETWEAGISHVAERRAEVTARGRAQTS